MKTLPSNIILAKNKISTTASWLVLLKITLTDNTVYRLVRNTEDVLFNDNPEGSGTSSEVYTAFNFQLEPSQQMSTGEIPTITLSVSNITRLIEAKLQELQGGIGSTVKIMVVNSDLLSENYSELEMTFDVIACNSNSQWVVFSLGAPSPLRQRFPFDKFYASQCRWRFKSAECGYVGATTACNRTLAQCRLRSNSARFGGFTGMRSGNVRVTG
jgi:phage-related protein